MYELYCRIYQNIFKAVSKLLPWRYPTLIEGENSTLELVHHIKDEGISNVLIVTDNVLESLGLLNGLLKSLEDNEVHYTLYNKTVPNPTIDNIEEAFQMYVESNAEAIIAFGGGSPMDCGKGVAAKAARPNKSIPKMKGVLKVLKRTPLLFAVPTTAGTGSEATIAAVISNSITHEKYAINDTVLIPSYAVLDPVLTIGLPKHITSTTGMDALTHAVEAYIGKSNTAETKQLSEKAVKIIYENIEETYHNGNNIEARNNMLKASYYAGVSFTRAYVGYVHAIAHTLGGFYQIPHGLANAVILPVVLEYYGSSVYPSLSRLAKTAGIGTKQTEKENAELFIESIKQLNRNMGIPSTLEGIKEEDIDTMVDRAFKESNPLYPVPKILTKKDLKNLYYLIKE